MNNSLNSRISKTVFILIITSVVFWFLYAVRQILLPFVVSAIFAYIMAPMVSYIQTHGIRRIVAVIALYICFLAIIAGFSSFLIPRIVKEASVLKNDMPKYSSNFKYVILDFQKEIEAKYPYLREKRVINTAVENTQKYLEQELSSIPSYLVGIFSLFSFFIIIPFVTFFFLLDGRSMMDKLFEMIPAKHVETTLSLISEINEVLGRFIRGQLIESALVALFTSAGLLFLGVNYAIILGILAGFANMVPYIGPIVSALPVIIIAFVQFQEVNIIFYVASVFVIVQFIDNSLLKPIVLSSGTDLDPVIVMFAIMAGAQIAGIIGMFLAVPVACIIKTTVKILLKQSRPAF